ncbi:replicative DNA helicase [Portibacter lacus]|uniref:Replicative DNA helicase n=1 Tax=Portibacter lacus TaxID=1099794 RepID=A0AA37SNB0_9BACT|nr:replicative DNA helicase [Portibacter lacus]GLR17746.1 replicative DNA helicase [Portibacter lacus]
MADQPKSLKSTNNRLKAVKTESDPSALGYGRVLPQAIPLEEAVLGAIMVDKDGLTSVIDILRKESFYKEEHKYIYEVMLELFEKSQPIDLLTVHESLKKSGHLESTGGVNYLMDLTHRVASAANIEYHARIVAQKFIQRELIRVSTETIKDSFEDTTDVFELLDAAERNLYEITEQNLSTGFESLKALAVKARNEIETVSAKSDGLTGVPTGFEELDKMTSGWQKSDLVIVAARPGMGKTAYTLSLAHNASKFGKGVAIFSLEMANLQLVNRLIAMEAEVDSRSLRNGDLSTEEWDRLHAAVERLSELPIYIDDTPGINIFELRAKCRRLKQNHNIEMIIIDYLQLMTGAPNGGGGNREQEISTISRALKGLAKELSVPVLALSQLSRAVETRGGNKRPQLSDLRESGAIEQDADMVTFIYRPAYYDLEPEDPSVPRDAAEIIISKHRNGSLGSVFLKFIPQFVKFAEPDNMGFGELPAMGDPFSTGIVTRPSKMNDDSSDIPNIPF